MFSTQEAKAYAVFHSIHEDACVQRVCFECDAIQHASAPWTPVPSIVQSLLEPQCALQMRRRREYSRMRSDEAKAEAGAVQAGVPAPDIPLQPTFDADNNSHRYRYMEPPPDAALCRYSSHNLPFTLLMFHMFASTWIAMLHSQMFFSSQRATKCSQHAGHWADNWQMQQDKHLLAPAAIAHTTLPSCHSYNT